MQSDKINGISPLYGRAPGLFACTIFATFKPEKQNICD